MRMEKKIQQANRADEHETEEFRERSDSGRTGELVDIVFDMNIHPW